MAFTPIRMVHRDGRECLVGSAIEREQLLTRGYRIAEPEPAAKPASTPKPAAKPAPKTDKKYL